MNNNYLKEMAGGGYTVENISSFHKMALPFLGENFFPNKSFKILDIGAGNGHTLIPLKNSGWKNLWALDIDDFNKKFFEDSGIGFIKANLDSEKIPFDDNYFDTVLSFHVIEHIQNLNNYLGEIRRVLKKGGILILVTPDWRKQYKIFWRDHTHIHPYDKESISRLLRAHDLNVVEIKSFGVIRGLGRTGLWKLFKDLIFSGIDMIAVSKK